MIVEIFLTVLLITMLVGSVRVYSRGIVRVHSTWRYRGSRRGSGYILQVSIIYTSVFTIRCKDYVRKFVLKQSP